jgi:8-oxo-dGTP diphosphatase
MSHSDTNPVTPPHVRIGGLGLILNESGDVLTVHPTYKGEGEKLYQLPGGGASEGEPDWQAVIREVWEETGLDVVPQRLLVKDWISVNETTGAAAGHNFVYYCGQFPDGTQISIPRSEGGGKPELDEYRWIPPAELDDYCAPYQVRRIREALAAHANGSFANLERGYPITQAAV